MFVMSVRFVVKENAVSIVLSINFPVVVFLRGGDLALPVVMIPVVPNSLVPRPVDLVVLPVAKMVNVVIPVVPVKVLVIISLVRFGGVAVVVDIDVAVGDSR